MYFQRFCCHETSNDGNSYMICDCLPVVFAIVRGSQWQWYSSLISVAAHYVTDGNEVHLPKNNQVQVDRFHSSDRVWIGVRLSVRIRSGLGLD